MLTKFKDIDHHQFYEGMIRMTYSQTDPYRQALFFVRLDRTNPFPRSRPVRFRWKQHLPGRLE